MSVQSNSLTLFVVDISSPMGEETVVQEKVVNHLSELTTIERKSTKLGWVCEFISSKIAEVILRGLKTTRVGIVTYGSPRTNNIVHDGGIRDEYLGIDEIFPPALPDLDTLDLVQSLRAVPPDQDVAPGDPLAALVDAIQLSSCAERGGIKDSQRNTWKRTVYLITDGRNPFSWDGADAIRDKINAEKIQLRVLGIDFDDEALGFKEEEKKPVKKSNEEFWHNFLAEIPEARIATAKDAVAQADLPSIQLTKLAPSKTILSFGDPDQVASNQVIQIPVALYKMTDMQRPMTQSKISKLAKESTAAAREKELEESKKRLLVPSSTPTLVKTDDDELASTPIYKADLKREYFLLDELGAIQDASGKAKPLDEAAESKFTRAWKLGASLIPVPDEAFDTIQTTKGLEILHFVDAKSYRREFNLDQIWYVFADHSQVKAQIELSSLIRGMAEMDLIAIVRLVRKDGGEPELGVLLSCVSGTYDCFYYSRVPFREDLRRFIFPPLDRLITKDGQEIRRGPTIPTDDEQEAMDQFVQSMDLMQLSEADEEGNQSPWFDILDSFNPAIHSLKAAVRHRFIHPEDDDKIPGPHPELTKYFETPIEVREKMDKVLQVCKDKFKVDYVPPKNNTERRKRLVSASKDYDDNSTNPREARLSSTAAAAAVKEEEANDEPPPRKAVKMENRAEQTVAANANDDDDDDLTEDELEVATSAAGNTFKTEVESQATRRTILDEQNPVAEFERLIKTDDVSKAMIAMMGYIRLILSEKQYEKVAECIKAAKRAAQEYEEAMRWNSFVRSLKHEMVETHFDFWDQTIRGKYEYGLVTDQEDEAGQSDVTYQDAKAFVETVED